MAGKACAPKKFKKPCAMLDEAGGGKWRVALFDAKDRPKGFLVSGPDGCTRTTSEKAATVFKNMTEVESALNKCETMPCPP